MQGIGKTLAEKIRVEAALKAQRIRLGLMEWAKQHIPQYFSREMSLFHNELCVELDRLEVDRGQKVLVVAPRGNAKSTWCSLARPLKAICEKSDVYILLVSDTSDQAEKYLKDIAAELEFNETLRAKYPVACEKGATWNASIIETKNGVCVEALGKGKNVRGRKYRGKRPTLIIVDDPQNDDDVISPNTRKKDVDWVDKALIPAGDTDTNYFIIGTNLHRESIVGTLMTRPDFKVIKYASIMEWPTNMELWEEWERLYLAGARDKCIEYYTSNKEMLDIGAKVLWPAKEDLLGLMIQRANMGHAAFASEKQNDPRDPSKCEFNDEWFKDDAWYDAIPASAIGYIRVGYADPAKGGETKKHDYSALVTLIYSPEHKCCFVECDMKKRPINITIDKMIELHNKHKYLAFGIETNGFQQLVADELVAKAPTFPVMPIANYGVHKNTRISRLGIWLQRGFYKFKRNCRDTKILVQQLLDHPHADHDDGSDSLEGATRVLTSTVDISVPTVQQDAFAIHDDGLGDNIFGGYV